ncbi:hypothetical protein LHFGNBLO_004404 [Mesorhizobium sp. AR10]|uniref:hypothetical protein n=1 Tax=Mesorhizobium sp. AR10 TaxID=2865839 RepID=UPI00215E0F82|nr:hypothetical protein [Mesorhizobium sp. AR10]UVK41769.1 hypothetical protein LHFGNBLO_004404 [Mesorhizobium sp. AR10]
MRPTRNDEGRLATAIAKPATVKIEIPSTGDKIDRSHHIGSLVDQQAVDQAADWYVAHRNTCERPVVVALRKRFGLTALEACRTLARAGEVAQ